MLLRASKLGVMSERSTISTRPSLVRRRDTSRSLYGRILRLLDAEESFAVNEAGFSFVSTGPGVMSRASSRKRFQKRRAVHSVQDLVLGSLWLYLLGTCLLSYRHAMLNFQRWIGVRDI